MTDSYHFESVAKFRVGGVYRSKDGRDLLIARLAPEAEGDSFYNSDIAVTVKCLCADGMDYETGWRRLSDGKYHARNYSGADLIPGELVERDGKWVAADSIGPFPSGATLKVAGDKIVGRVSGTLTGVKVTVAGGTSYAPSVGGPMIVTVCGGGVSSSPVQRAPLPNSDEWRGIGHKAHDTFGPDFIVTKGAEPTSPLYDSPTTDSAYPAIAGLLRG